MFLLEGRSGLVRRQVLRLLFGVALGALPLSLLWPAAGKAMAATETRKRQLGNGNPGTATRATAIREMATPEMAIPAETMAPERAAKAERREARSGEQAGASEETAQDQDRALQAVEEGRALPLSAVLPRIERKFGGRVIDAALREVGKRLLYDLKMLSPGGRVFTVSVDAATGRPSGGIGM